MVGRFLTLCALLAVLVAANATPSSAAASTDGRVVLVNGTPFFPLMLINECKPTDVAHAEALGINLILNETCEGLSVQRQLSMIGGHSQAVLPIEDSHVRGSGLVGWTYPDEPENNNWTPSSLANATTDPTHDNLISFITTGGGFFRAPYRDPRVALPAYSQFASLANVAGFDLYPLGHCQHDLSAVYDAQRIFNGLAGNRPTFQWIETGPIKPTYCGGFTMTPAQLHAEVWLAITGGATGIGFFTHTWTPNENELDVSPSLQQEMKSITGQIAALTPGLLGMTVLSGANSGAIKVIARSTSDRTYVFAVNATNGPIHAQIHVPRLQNGRVAVNGEGRAVAVRNDRLTDTFGPLAVHVYVQAG
jgi:hypothetical protein